MIMPKFGTGLFGNPKQRFHIPPGCRMDLGCNYARYDILIKPRKGMKGVNTSRSCRQKSTALAMAWVPGASHVPWKALLPQWMRKVAVPVWVGGLSCHSTSRPSVLELASGFPWSWWRDIGVLLPGKPLSMIPWDCRQPKVLLPWI